MEFTVELWRFMRVRKKFWLLPILAMTLLFGGLVVLVKGSAVAPFITRCSRPPMRVLGISAFYHDSAAALIEDNRIIAAAQEERFTRKKFDANYPRHAIEYCLKAGGVALKDV